MTIGKRVWCMADFPYLLTPYAQTAGFSVTAEAARQWALRTRRGDMHPPLPEPDVRFGPAQSRGWYAETIISWYCRWKGLDRQRIEAIARGEQAAEYGAR